jgi:Zn-dependent M28 family amino/carboxypeptidase
LQIQRLAGKDEGVFQLTTHGSLEPATTWNVVGELPGVEFPDELVVIGGHLDSHEIGPGAFDNAAGTVVVMEAARLLAKQRKHLKRTIRFIGFAGEEIGLLGSHCHAAKHAAELQKARFMLNCDMPSLGRPRGLAFHKCPKAEPYMALLAEQMETPVLCQNRAHCHSDHYPFILQGVPTAGVAGGKFGPAIQHFAHMAGDTPDKISLTDLRDTAAFIARMLVRAANDDQWPDMRRSAAEVSDWQRM